MQSKRDFHKMIVSVKKTDFKKQEPKIIQYRDYSNFSADDYQQYILSLLFCQDLTRSGFDTFMTECKDAFEIRVPTKRKYLRSNQSYFRNKRFQKLSWIA